MTPRAPHNNFKPRPDWPWWVTLLVLAVCVAVVVALGTVLT